MAYEILRPFSGNGKEYGRGDLVPSSEFPVLSAKRLLSTNYIRHFITEGVTLIAKKTILLGRDEIKIGQIFPAINTAGIRKLLQLGWLDIVDEGELEKLKESIEQKEPVFEERQAHEVAKDFGMKYTELVNFCKEKLNGEIKSPKHILTPQVQTRIKRLLETPALV